MKLPLCVFWMFGVSSIALCVKGEPFLVTLELQGRTATQSVTNAPALNRPASKARAVLNAGVDEPLKIRFRVAQAGGPAVEHGRVHIYVASEETLNQMSAPDLKEARVILESALSSNFKTDSTARGTFSFRVSQPGLYLVRVEGLDLEPEGKDQPVASLDLVVKGDAAK